MDGGGRFAQSLKALHARTGQGAIAPARDSLAPIERRQFSHRNPWKEKLTRFALPEGVGTFCAALIIIGSLAYGAVRGGHVDVALDAADELRNALASAAGFGLAGVTINGLKQLSEPEALAAAGVSPGTSLLFFDVEEARTRLKAVPWVAEASVRKLYPDRLDISLTERDAFAMWQKDGRVSIIAADGVVVGQVFGAPRSPLPLVVGHGAELRAKHFLDILDRHPTIRSHVRAAILVAERRWNLKLKNGLDVRLPEIGIEQALELLANLDRDRQLLSRDITMIDLRLPDRVTVRLSDPAAEKREEVLKENKAKRKGGDA